MRGNRFILILLFLAAYIFAAKIGGTISYLFLYLIIFIPLMSMFYLGYVYVRFRIYQHLEKKVIVKGDHIVYKFHLTNEDVIAYTDVRVTFEKKTSKVEGISPDTSYCLLPKEEIKKETKLCPLYRGQYFVGIDHVIVRDFFHLFEMKYSYKDKIEVTVMPRVLQLDKLELGPNVESLKTKYRGEATKQQIRDNEVRKYQSGDSMKLIHWKASARTNSLLSLKYIEEPKTEVLTVLDLSEHDVEEYVKIVSEDKLLEAVLAIHHYFSRHLIPSSVIYGDSKIRVRNIQNSQDFDSFYNTCKSLGFHSQYSFIELLGKAIKIGKNTGTIIVMTASLDSKLCFALNEAVDYGLNLTILYVGNESLSLEKSLLNGRIHLHVIRLDEEVEEVLTNRRGGHEKRGIV